MRTFQHSVILFLVLVLGMPALAQDAPPVKPGADVKYSPYPEQNFPNQVFFVCPFTT